ncbi:MAG: hypothetical protein RLZZ592_1243 [Pseudomonadota bacterium]|jgi:hypothetical protein|nr:hypothetical protein [Pseudomonadota bacterium]
MSALPSARPRNTRRRPHATQRLHDLLAFRGSVMALHLLALACTLLFGLMS